MALNIAFLAWNARQADTYLHQLAEANADQVKKYDRTSGRVTLHDGTVISIVNPDKKMDGKRFDQIIVADDWRMGILLKMWDALEYLELLCQHSDVPEDFRYQFYFIDEEDGNNGET